MYHVTKYKEFFFYNFIDTRHMNNHFSIIVAYCTNGGIGFKGRIPWSIPGDLQHFYYTTTTTRDPQKQNAVVMGRNTWQSLPKKPLPKRRNVIISTSSQDMRGQEVYPSLDSALSVLWRENDIENIFVIGGQRLYEEAITHPMCKHAYVTVVHNNYDCDVFFPRNKLYQPNEWKETECSAPFKTIDAVSYSFLKFERVASPRNIDI